MKYRNISTKSGEITGVESGTNAPNKIIFISDYQDKNLTGTHTTPTEESISNESLSTPITTHSLQRRANIPKHGTTFTNNITSINKHKLSEAFFLISDSYNMEYEDSERSNCFDAWKDILETLCREESSFDIKHRKILGSLLIATKKKDVSDFNILSLKVFQESTNDLRLPQITKQECNRVIKKILSLGDTIILPISPQDITVENERELESMMMAIINKNHEYK